MYTPSTRRLLTSPSIKPYILTKAFILNFLQLLIKQIRQYLLGVNTTLYQRVYTIYTLYTLFRALQFFSIVLLYISILKLLINLNAIVVPPYSFSRSIQVLKKRNRISNSAKPQGILVFVYIIYTIYPLIKSVII